MTNYKSLQYTPKIKEEVHFIKVNELKLTEVEFSSFFHFKWVADNIFELFCMAHLANNERFFIPF